MSRFECPTAEQIRAINDADSLQHIIDECAVAIDKITADMQGSDDREWRHRAARSREHLRTAKRVAIRQMGVANHGEHRRLESECRTGTNEIMADRFVIDASKMETVEQIDAAELEIAVVVDDLERDRADEVDRPAQERDYAWLIRSSAAVKRAGAWRRELAGRRSALRKAAHEARNNDRKQKFIEAARTLLPEETYKALWAHVDSQ